MRTRGASSPPPQGRPGGSPRWYKPVEERVAGAEGRAQRRLRARRRLTPSPGRGGAAGRAGGGRSGERTRGGARAGGRGAAASGSAAARRSRDHAWPHPRYRYAPSPALSTPPPLSTRRPGGGHLKIDPPGCPLHTHLRARSRCTRPEGGGRVDREEE